MEHYLGIAGFHKLEKEDVLSNFANYYENKSYNGVIIIPKPSTSIYKNSKKLVFKLIGVRDKEEFDALDNLIIDLINSIHR